MYISANMGAGPRDSLMLAVVNKTGRRVGLVMTVIEGIVLALGYWLGGPVGWGTVIAAVSIGWLVESGLSFFRWCSGIGSLGSVIEVRTGQPEHKQA